MDSSDSSDSSFHCHIFILIHNGSLLNLLKNERYKFAAKPKTNSTPAKSKQQFDIRNFIRGNDKIKKIVNIRAKQVHNVALSDLCVVDNNKNKLVVSPYE
jgi:hypothetical protein